METTLFLTQIIGPVLVLRGISILIDWPHFEAMVDGLDKEVTTVAFSLFPIALMMAAIAILRLHNDTSTLAGVLLLVIGWGGVVKASMLILFPKMIVAKAHLVRQTGFLNVVLAVCLTVGAYFTWFGYFQSTT